MHITRTFLEGMRDATPQEIHVIDVIDRHIEYCTGCFACKRNGGTCVHDDDMREILEEILESDLLLFSFPLYCYGMPAPLKALLDRPPWPCGRSATAMSTSDRRISAICAT